MTIAGPPAALEAIRAAEGDLKSAGRIRAIYYTEAERVEIRDAVLIPPPPKA